VAPRRLPVAAKQPLAKLCLGGRTVAKKKAAKKAGKKKGKKK
jgi:hypothetical protein